MTLTKIFKINSKNSYFSKRLYEAILYVINVGGKRLRPLLLLKFQRF